MKFYILLAACDIIKYYQAKILLVKTIILRNIQDALDTNLSYMYLSKTPSSTKDAKHALVRHCSVDEIIYVPSKYCTYITPPNFWVCAQ